MGILLVKYLAGCLFLCLSYFNINRSLHAEQKESSN